MDRRGYGALGRALDAAGVDYKIKTKPNRFRRNPRRVVVVFGPGNTTPGIEATTGVLALGHAGLAADKNEASDAKNDPVALPKFVLWAVKHTHGGSNVRVELYDAADYSEAHSSQPQPEPPLRQPSGGEES